MSFQSHPPPSLHFDMAALVVMETEACGSSRLSSHSLCKATVVLYLSAFPLLLGSQCLDLLAVGCGVPFPVEEILHSYTFPHDEYSHRT